MLSMDETLDVLKATFTLVTTSIGAGILAIPYGFAAFGWWTFVIITVVSALMLTGALLLNEALKVSRSFTYVDLGEEHLGRLGKYGLQFSLVFNTYFVTIIYVVLTASSFQALFAKVSDLDYVVWVVITIAAMYPIGMLPEVKDMVGMMVFGAICSYGVGIVIMVESGMDLDEPFEFESPEDLGLSTGIKAAAVFIFAYTFAVLVPNTRRNMKYPKNMHYPIILVVACLLTIYTSVGAFNHAAYGCEIPFNILTKYDRNILWYIANLLVAGNLLVSGPLLLNPFVITVESVLLKIPIEYTQAVTQPATVDSAKSADEDVTVVDPEKAETGTNHPTAEIDKLPEKTTDEHLQRSAKSESEGNWFYRHRFGLGRVVLRSVVWASIMFVALVIPFFDNLQGAVVGLALTFQTMVAPLIIYWAIYRESLGMHVKVFFGVVIAVLTIFAGFSTYFSVHDIVETASSFRIFKVPHDDESTYLCPV
eukprot:Clim_evm131s109 gene=Clim_evmTU131s109